MHPFAIDAFRIVSQFGVFIAILFTIGQSTISGQIRKHLALLFFLCSLSLLLIHICLLQSSFYSIYPATPLFFFPVFFLAAPLLYLTYLAELEERTPNIRWLYHLIPGVIVISITGFFYYERLSSGTPIKEGETKIADLLFPYSSSGSFVWIFTILGFYFSYFFALAFRIRLRWRPNMLRDEISMRLLFLSFGTIFFPVSGILLFPFWGTLSVGIGGVLSTIILIYMHVILPRYPKVLNALNVTLENRRRKYSFLSQIPVEQILSKMDLLMKEEKLYQDEDLSLPSFAKMVGISEHQLSELLNKEVKKNFTLYINEFRVREAESILLTEPDGNILAIAYKVGFNSKSAFYKTFRKVTGISPTEYRRKKSTMRSYIRSVDLHK